MMIQRIQNGFLVMLTGDPYGASSRNSYCYHTVDELCTGIKQLIQQEDVLEKQHPKGYAEQAVLNTVPTPEVNSLGMVMDTYAGDGRRPRL